MTTTEAPRGVSVPSTGQSVKDLLAEAVAGTPVRIVGMGLSVDAGACVDAVAEACVRLFRVSSKMTVATNFCVGDAYESAPPYSAARKSLLGAVSAALGSSYADRLRGFGSVCRRWPLDRRSEKLPWDYYRTHEPGVPGKPDKVREQRPKPLKIVGRSALPHGVLLTCEGYAGQLFTVVYTPDRGS